MLLQLRRLEARLLLLPPIFQSLTQAIQTLQAMNNAFQADGAVSDETHRATQETLQNYDRMAAAYLQNATFILQKIRATAQMLSDTLKMKDQQIAQNISKNTLALNNRVVQDSGTIRVITVVTLLFLPGQFIAVMLLPTTVSNRFLLTLRLKDTFRDAIFLHHLNGVFDGLSGFPVDVFCHSCSVHRGHIRILEMDG